MCSIVCVIFIRVWLCNSNFSISDVIPAESNLKKKKGFWVNSTAGSIYIFGLFLFLFLKITWSHF
jgi:hypothetical protein